MHWRELFIGFVLGALLTGASVFSCHDRQVEALKVYADSVAGAARSLTVRVTTYAEAQRQRADSLAAVRRPIIAAARADSGIVEQLELSLADQRTTADSNVVLRAEVRALKRQALGLWQALVNAEAQLLLERQRGDSLQKVTALLNRDIQGLRGEVVKLRGRPQWLRISAKVLEVAVILKAGYEWGQDN